MSTIRDVFFNKQSLGFFFYYFFFHFFSFNLRMRITSSYGKLSCTLDILKAIFTSKRVYGTKRCSRGRHMEVSLACEATLITEQH